VPGSEKFLAILVQRNFVNVQHCTCLSHETSRLDPVEEGGSTHGKDYRAIIETRRREERALIAAGAALLNLHLELLARLQRQRADARQREAIDWRGSTEPSKVPIKYSHEAACSGDKPTAW
jgi:hypothetical protein